MSENTDIVASYTRRHKLNQETITATPENATVWGKKKRKMERNKYIMFSVNKTGEKVEALGTAIKGKKSRPTRRL